VKEQAVELFFDELTADGVPLTRNSHSILVLAAAGVSVANFVRKVTSR